VDETVKRAIKKTILALRKLLERQDIPAVLKQYGIFPDGRRVPVEKLALLDESGKKRRERLEAIIDREVQAVGGDQKAGVERYCREVAFTYLNRLIALRSMEARGLLDECIKIREDYAGRSLRHHRFLKENPGIQFDAEDTDSFKAFLRSVFRELQDDIKILFDPDDEYSIIMPTLNTLRECIRALNEDIPEGAFKEPELIGWVYQYFQTEEKNRVFEEVRTKKKKIEGDDIIPATSLYTERYMVDYLVQNSLGAIWMEMYRDSKLCESCQYFVKDQDLKPREARPVKSLTFLDPACGSGHFHLVAFDLLAQMYEEEIRLAAEGKIPKEWVVPKEKIATTILESNLHGIDIDLRSVQLSYLVLYLRMREHQGSVGAPKLLPVKVNLVAADASLLNTPEFLSWCEERFKEEPYAINIIKGVVGRLRNLSEIGSLARPEEDLKELIHKEKERLLSAWKKEKSPKQFPLFREMLTPEQQELPFEKITDDQFWEGVLSRVTKALDEYYKEASERGDTKAQVFAHEASRGFKFLELCNKRYDVVATNPPYMGLQNLGDTLRDYMNNYYEMGKVDLFAAFIIRNTQLASPFGYISMITQQSWMFLGTLEQLRKWLLSNMKIRVLAHLGPGAFSEIGGEVVNTAMFCICKSPPDKNGKSRFISAVKVKDVKGKEEVIKKIPISENNIGYFIINQNDFFKVPGAPLSYWVSDKVRDTFASNPSLSKYSKAMRGMATGDNPRYVRFWWEVKHEKGSNLWVIYGKGGLRSVWYAACDSILLWSQAAQKWYGTSPKARSNYLSGYFSGVKPNNAFKECLSVYSIGSWGLEAAYHPPGRIIDQSANPVFSAKANLLNIMSYLNSRFAKLFSNCLNPTSNVLVGDIQKLPFRKELIESSILRECGQECLNIIKLSASYNMIITDFSHHSSGSIQSLRDVISGRNKMIQETDNMLQKSQNLIEQELIRVFGFSVDEEQKFIEESSSVKEIRSEELSEATPVTLFADETEEPILDYLSTIILMLIGFRWPKQIEANEPIPDWTDKDGIIPITEHTEEKTLLERIRDRIGAEFGENKIGDIESEFADILYNAASKKAEIRGKIPPKKKLTLAQWLEKECFKRHTSQFKKRPVAWHLTSTNGTFQVLIFCHKISLDMFKNLKNRHLAKVQSYYGSLLERARRGESVPGGLTAGKLSDIELELEEFSNKLHKIITMPYEPSIDDGVRINIAPLQKLGLLASPVLAAKDVDRAIADRNRWREEDKQQTTFWNL
jgi:hypothetical protein